MKFEETPLAGAFVLSLEERRDDRGLFARTYCAREFEEHGITARVAQANVSHNFRKGTLRGMHYQTPPAEEAKLVRCTRGAIYDAIVDLREGSPSHMQSFGVELTADNRKALFVPEGFAHGYLTLCDDAEVVYQVSEFYSPGYEQGLRYDDPKLGIKWPVPVVETSEKDAKWPLLP